MSIQHSDIRRLFEEWPAAVVLFCPESGVRFAYGGTDLRIRSPSRTGGGAPRSTSPHEREEFHARWPSGARARRQPTPTTTSKRGVAAEARDRTASSPHGHHGWRKRLVASASALSYNDTRDGVLLASAGGIPPSPLPGSATASSAARPGASESRSIAWRPMGSERPHSPWEPPPGQAAPSREREAAGGSGPRTGRTAPTRMRDSAGAEPASPGAHAPSRPAHPPRRVSARICCTAIATVPCASPLGRPRRCRRC